MSPRVRFEDVPRWRYRVAALSDALNVISAQRAYVRGEEFHVLTSRDEIEPRDIRWHLSIAGERNVPPWDIMVAVAHAMHPGVCFAIGVPPRAWWINVHPNVLHLWELRDPPLLALWKAEALGHTPT